MAELKLDFPMGCTMFAGVGGVTEIKNFFHLGQSIVTPAESAFHEW
jgi:hypothetical protein